MRNSITAVEAEYRRFKALAEGAIAQLDESELCQKGAGDGNSIAVLVWHVSGNLASRFTDFLSTDGEKPWRRRDEEFVLRTVDRHALLQKWNTGWDVVLAALSSLSDDDLARQVTIRHVPFRVDEALYRSLAHTAYHVGQIVFLAKALRGDRWKWLTIPPGQSDTYNSNPTLDRPTAHVSTLSQRGSE
jgi:hypothetical protein